MGFVVAGLVPGDCGSFSARHCDCETISLGQLAGMHNDLLKETASCLAWRFNAVAWLQPSDHYYQASGLRG
jgi:hypothetical protein